jgi:signal peptidase I
MNDLDLVRKFAIITLLGALMFTGTYALSNHVKQGQISNATLENRVELFRGYAAFLARSINFTIAGSWDMGKTISENDTVMWVEVNPSELQGGDVIIYSDPSVSGNPLVAHRIIGISGNSFITKGDGNLENDLYMVSGELEGIVIGVVYYRAP